MKISRWSIVALAVVAIVPALGSPGCSNQGEGQPCSSFNGNDDCENGLVCATKDYLKGKSDYCCPPKGTPSSFPECIPGATSTVDGGAGGSAGAGGSDSGADAAGGSAGEDAASDGAAGAAGADASDDTSDAVAE